MAVYKFILNNESMQILVTTKPQDVIAIQRLLHNSEIPRELKTESPYKIFNHLWIFYKSSVIPSISLYKNNVNLKPLLLINKIILCS